MSSILLPSLPHAISEASFFYQWASSPSPADIALSAFKTLKRVDIANGAGSQLSYARVGKKTSLLLGNFPAEVWQRLPLSGHSVVNPPADIIESFRDAMRHLEARHEDAAKTIGEFLPLVCWTESSVERGGDEDDLITSCSLPAFPFASFFSRKALHHIPPKVVLGRPSVRYLAENIYHEAIHNSVNAMAIDDDLFSDNYDGKTFPKIVVPWRSDAVARNQEWEFDRVLHACAVYVGICSFRIAELADSELADDERAGFQKALTSGLEGLAYLIGQVHQRSDWLGEAGHKLVADITASCALLHAKVGM